MLALACGLSAAPLAALADPATQPAETPAPREDAQAEPDTGSEAEQDKRVCRYVKLETASRRKTKVCRTVEEWRELNNPR